MSLDDTGRTEEGYAATAQLDPGGREDSTSLRAVTAEDGVEECLFTVPIVVEKDIAYYRGVKVNDIPTPRNFNHVKTALFKVEWEGAMDGEINPLIEKGTWMPVYPEEGDKIMGCLWVCILIEG